MKVVELREKSIDELFKVADELKIKIHQTQMELATNKSQNHGLIRNTKKDLARVLTVVSEKQRSA